MAFKDFPAQSSGVELLQRSLERGRLAHAYLLAGDQPEELEQIARTLAQTLNCQRPVRKGAAAIDCCGQCLACRKIEHGNHPDVHWLRPESKLRVIKIEQIRDLIQELSLKPAEAEHKVAVIVAADRLQEKAGNAFLKTLEEPPGNSTLILLTAEPQRLLETIVSRCLRLNFIGEGIRGLAPENLAWLGKFSDLAAAEQKSLLGRYRLLDVVLRRLNELKGRIEERLEASSPLARYEDLEPQMQEQLEDELAAAIEAEYRRQRADLLRLLQWWLRDVWLQALQRAGARGSGARHDMDTAELLGFPELTATRRVAERVSPEQATGNLKVMEDLQYLLGTNVQEALALEVGLLKLRL